MAPINLNELRIHHIIDSTHDFSTFAAARDSSNKLRLFLVKETGVYARNGQTDAWKELVGSLADNIRYCISKARDFVPVYKSAAALSN